MHDIVGRHRLNGSFRINVDPPRNVVGIGQASNRGQNPRAPEARQSRSPGTRSRKPRRSPPAGSAPPAVSARIAPSAWDGGMAAANAGRDQNDTPVPDVEPRNSNIHGAVLFSTC